MAQPKKGQPYLPDVIQAVVQRYRFQKYPSTFDELISDTKTFNVGVWNDAQIEELSVYNDGLIVGARCPTDTLDGFCDDLLAFVSKGFDVKPVADSEHRHYESAVVVKLDEKILSKLAFLDVVNDGLAAFQQSYGLGSFGFQPVSLESGVDMTTCAGKRPLTFSLTRRVHVPFEEGIWFSTAPLKTSDHVALLQNVEDVMKR